MPGKFSLGPGQKFTVSSFGIFTSLLQSSPQFLVQGLCSRWGLRSAVQGLGCWVSLHLWAAILGPGFAYLAVFSMGRARRPSGLSVPGGGSVPGPLAAHCSGLALGASLSGPPGSLCVMHGNSHHCKLSSTSEGPLISSTPVHQTSSKQLSQLKSKT